MRRITLWALSTVAALVLLFSYRTSTSGPGATQETAQVATQSPQTDSGSTTSDSGSGSASGSSSDSGSGSGSASSGSGSSGSTGSGKSGTFQGSVAQTRWGPVQVSVTVATGKVTEVNVLTYPSGNHRDEEINAYALPILRQEALQKQSADIDSVSGATVTSDGYRESLQAALDAAGLS